MLRCGYCVGFGWYYSQRPSHQADTSREDIKGALARKQSGLFQLVKVPSALAQRLLLCSISNSCLHTLYNVLIVRSTVFRMLLFKNLRNNYLDNFAYTVHFDFLKFSVKLFIIYLSNLAQHKLSFEILIYFYLSSDRISPLVFCFNFLGFLIKR